MHNPYAGVNWGKAKRVPSASHMHLVTQANLDIAYRYGIRRFPISNYGSSAPYDAGTKLSDCRLRQGWSATRDGKQIDPPINWNDIIDWHR